MRYFIGALVFWGILFGIGTLQVLENFLKVDPFNGQAAIFILAVLGVGGTYIMAGVTSLLFERIIVKGKK